MPEDILNSMLKVVVTFILMNFIFAIFYVVVIYFLLKKIDTIVPNMNKYSVAMYTLITLWLTKIIITSIISKTFVFTTIGILPVILTFLIPYNYKIKNIENVSNQMQK